MTDAHTQAAPKNTPTIVKSIRVPRAPLLPRLSATGSVDSRMAVVQRYVLLAAGGLLAVAGLFAVATAQGSMAFWRVIAVYGATIIAAACVGGLTGFLFGIPRLLQRMEGGRAGEGTPTTDATRMAFVDLRNGRSRSVGGNSNLEEVSDWLTKIIVGLTLVHLADIKTHLLSFSAKLATATGSQGDATFTGFILCLILSSFVLGFLSIYLEARTRVATLISDTELMLDGSALDDQAARISYNAGVLGPISSDTPMVVLPAPPTSQDAELVAFPYSRLSTAQDYAAWGAAQARSGNYLAAVRAMTDAITQEPGNQSYLMLLANVRRLQRMPQAEFDVLQEVVDRGGANNDLIRRRLLVALYIPPPDGFRFVIAQVTAPGFALGNDPEVLLDYAAALGQEVKWLHNNPGTRTDQEVKDAIAALRDKTLDVLKQIEASSPDRTKGVRRSARLLFDPSRPGGTPSENDLEVFKDDPDFKALLAP